jgi:hypothetical protein
VGSSEEEVCRDEPTWVVILYAWKQCKNLLVLLSVFQTSKNALFFLLFVMVFCSTKLENKRREQVLPERGVAQIMYTPVSKCKDGKIKLKKKKDHEP